MSAVMNKIESLGNPPVPASGVGAVKAVEPVSALVDRLASEYAAAKARILA